MNGLSAGVLKHFLPPKIVVVGHFRSGLGDIVSRILMPSIIRRVIVPSHILLREIAGETAILDLDTKTYL